ncbi:uncharacterized protein LOC131950027 [Physella acuta]|uniref:uncharacterized protein LOC131950027 n=1 Tax=Physella acuta TaxID=109671 RepID=UPI0027DCF70A|nr:uncharacterized protein LOC131950027 [Physella acuta]XP_059168019.1 uncharacterized protein LOC131950027 [Physella acuta]XP_059168020.1 uncharacterized protein LOC131950027 [Physella acuta]XP_059168023.1 uncharacterized protein LOC131950027 [Physella acuta]
MKSEMDKTLRVCIVIVLCAFINTVCSRTEKRSYNESDAIESDNYPGPYPPALNLTWEWTVGAGIWAVIFVEFSLDDGDWLTIWDGQKAINYDGLNRPIQPYITVTHQLRISFVSVNKTKGSEVKGFQDGSEVKRFRLQILHALDKVQAEIKIHEFRESLEKQATSSPNSLVVILSVTLVTLVALAAIVVFIRYRMGRKGNSRLDAAFSAQMNGGARHSRGEEHLTADTALGEPRRTRQPRALQQSTSQLTWIARAQLNTSSQQPASPTHRPNPYNYIGSTSPSDVRVLGIALVEDPYAEQPPYGPGSNPGRPDVVPEDDSYLTDLQKVFKCVTVNSGSQRRSQNRSRFSYNRPGEPYANQPGEPYANQLVDNLLTYESGVDDSTDTKDFLVELQDESPREHNESNEPPSYESLMCGTGSIPSQSYDNIVPGVSHAGRHCVDTPSDSVLDPTFSCDLDPLARTTSISDNEPLARVTDTSSNCIYLNTL